MTFVHLHNHTHYSLLDGLSRPSELVKKAKEYNMPAIAITDHGVMYGVVEFFKAAKEEGIKPILGCEVYITRDRFKKDSTVRGSNHLVLLAENDEGYKNLLKLVSKAQLEGFYYKPRIDHELLREHSKGLIALSACINGEVSKAVLAHDYKKAKEIALEYNDIMGQDNFFLEIQDHLDIDEQIIVNSKLIELSKETGIPLVATNDSHYPETKDQFAHDLLICIQTGKNFNDEDRMRYASNFSIKSPDEMIEAMKAAPEAIENTLKIAERCNVEIEFGQNLVPEYPLPEGYTTDQLLYEKAMEGLRERYPDDEGQKKAIERLDYEMSVISKMGFSDYFLIVQDFIIFAKENGIIVGPGRGSAAGAILSYCLDITTVDPLKYSLLFERFLNPERVSMPDIDIDFADHRRHEVFDYVREKYGDANVAQVITFGKMTAKAAVRDVGRAMGYPYSEVDAVSKKMPPTVFGKHRPIKESIVEDDTLSKEYNENPRSKELLDNAIKLEGTIRNAGTHACAVIISEQPLTNFTPLQNASGKEGIVVTQYAMGPLEEIGLLKVDFLGLRNLTILEHTLNIIKIKHDITLELKDIPLDDKETFKLLSRGETTGVFQLESGGMRKYLKELKPTRLEDIIAMNALYRPGPMEYIPDYIRGKHNPKSVKYMDPVFKPILEETSGIAIYQEQILQIARDFAGFSLGQADILRRAVGKKKLKLLEEQKIKFIDGAVANGFEKKMAVSVFTDIIEPFAGYGFNKSHATCYALIAYQTAYLKALYPTEFMAALLTADKENTERVVLEINDCKQMKIQVLPPSINESFKNFTVVNEGVIRFGLAAIKGLGVNTIDKIIESRQTNGKFESLENFLEKVDSKLVNKKTIESLAYAGAFDEFGDRHTIAQACDYISKYAKNAQKKASEGQTSIFGIMDDEVSKAVASLNLPAVKPITELQVLKREKDFLGLYVSAHPLQGLGRYMSSKMRLIGSLNKKDEGKDIKIGGLVTAVRRLQTKKGDNMMYATIEDPTGDIEVVLFPRMYNMLAKFIELDNIVTLDGKLDNRRNKQLMVRGVRILGLESMKENAIKKGVYDRNEVFVFEEDLDEEIEVIIPKNASKDDLTEFKDILAKNPGSVSVKLTFMDGDKITRTLNLNSGINLSDEIEKEISKIFKLNN